MDHKNFFFIFLIISIVVIICVVIDLPFMLSVREKKDFIQVTNGVGYSMYPFIDNGDKLVVLMSDYPDFDVNAGDIIVYYDQDIGYVGHRIYDISGDRYFVKGDNNDFSDKTIRSSQIVGKIYGIIDRDNFLEYNAIELFIK